MPERTRHPGASRAGSAARVRRCRGTTILECLMALFVLSLALLGLARLVAAAGQQRRLTEAKSAALAELANQAEQVAALPWEATAPDALQSWTPSAELAAVNPATVCQIRVTEEAGPPAGRRIRLQIAWTDPAGRQQKPSSLTVWKYPVEHSP